jgi:hypothetical protein
MAQMLGLVSDNSFSADEYIEIQGTLLNEVNVVLGNKSSSNAASANIAAQIYDIENPNRANPFWVDADKQIAKGVDLAVPIYEAAKFYAYGAIGGAILGPLFRYTGLSGLFSRAFNNLASKFATKAATGAIEDGTTIVYRNFGWNEFNSLRANGNMFEIGSNFGSKQFWLDEQGINWWNNTSFAKNFTAKITVNNEALINGYKFMDAGKYNAISFDSQEALNIFNNNMKIEWIQYK